MQRLHPSLQRKHLPRKAACWPRLRLAPNGFVKRVASEFRSRPAVHSPGQEYNRCVAYEYLGTVIENRGEVGRLLAQLIRVKSSCGACVPFGNLYRCIGSDEQAAGQRAPLVGTA